MKMFKVGDRVKIVRYSPMWNGMLGFIESINGGYIYVRPRWSKHQIELYSVELEHANSKNR